MQFKLYLLFVISFFLHLPARIPILGLVRFDLLLLAVIAVLLFMNRSHDNNWNLTKTDKILRMLLVYVLFTVLFVEWPGSVLRTGIPNLVKSVIFYFYTVAIISTKERLRIFMVVFLACQCLRVLEPLYLHLTDGYWGSATYIGDGEMMARLSGAPSDTINANGLAFVIVSVIPFMHYLTLSAGWRYKLVYFLLLPVFLYTLVLTASRSGILGLAAIFFGLFIKSKCKFWLVVVGMIGAIIVVANLSDLHKERYLSIWRDDVRFSGTAHGRLEGLKSNLEVVYKRPIFGHGLGTSVEANFHITGLAKAAHNLYLEILQEIGIIGLLIFLTFMKSIVGNFQVTLSTIRKGISVHSYLAKITTATQVWLLMNFLFSLASYGLSSYEWYLFGGLSVVIRKLAEAESRSSVSVEDMQWRREFAFSR